MVDVIVTTFGGASTSRAIIAGGGLVGMRSSATRPPKDVPVEFVDWPFQLDQPSLGKHRGVVRRERPKYAVAPDIEGDRTFEEVIEEADQLAGWAENVIVVPKSVPAGDVPRRFRVGVPFRDEFDTPLGVNSFADFQGLSDLHVLGGIPTDHFKLRDRFGLDVASIDTPKMLAWADHGRVWIANRRSADEVNDLDPQLFDDVTLRLAGLPTLSQLRESREARVQFSVRNLVMAWDGLQIAIERRVAPGRGPPPPAPEPGMLGPANTAEEAAAIEERFRETGVEEVELGRVEREERLGTLRETIENDD